MRIDWDVPIKMDDGLILRADVFRPAEPLLASLVLRFGGLRSSAARDLVRRYARSHVLLGTDYPYGISEADPVGFIESAHGLTDADRVALCGGNAARLLGIGRTRATKNIMCLGEQSIDCRVH